MRKGTLVEVLAPETRLRRSLLNYARTFLGLALPIAALTGVFVYFAVSLLLVRPIRQITHSIVAFRADPERTPPLDPSWLTLLPGGEISAAGLELAAMQRDLRTALWRNARLAALGAAIAKVSHDLRNSLSPALLSAERLEMHPDPAVRRSGATLLRAIDNATEMVGRMLEFAREVPPQLAVTTVDLGKLGEEAAEMPQPAGRERHRQPHPARHGRVRRPGVAAARHPQSAAECDRGGCDPGGDPHCRPVADGSDRDRNRRRWAGPSARGAGQAVPPVRDERQAGRHRVSGSRSPPTSCGHRAEGSRSAGLAARARCSA